MHSGEEFSLTWITADKQRNRGGEIISVTAARLTSKANYTPVADRQYRSPEGLKLSRDAHHWQNGSRNITLENGKIRKVHIQLIIEINGFRVLN